jgi:acetamidase/formamidase
MATIEVKPTSYHYVFSPYIEPLVRVKPGDDVIVYTNDACESRIHTREDLPSKALAGVKFLNPQSGPIYVEGAEPGDTLAVTIKDITYTRDYAWSAFIKYFGGLTSTTLTPMLQDPIPEKVWIWKLVDDGKAFYEEELDIKIPSKPFLGTFGVAPYLEAIQALTPGAFGGNMDVPEVCPGNTIYLPVHNEGALFYTGDCHAAQGQGELCGVALEITAKSHLVFNVIKGKTINNPRIESEDKIMAVGSVRPMEDAARIAYMELINWMASDYGFSKIEAYQLLTQVGGCHVGNMVDTVYSLVASIEKKYLKRCGGLK